MSIFINPEEKRLRAPWRFLVMVPVLFILVMIFSALAGIIIAGYLMAQGLPVTVEYVNQMSGAPFVRVSGMIAQGLGLLVGCLILGKWVDRRKFSSFGFQLSAKWWRDFGFGLALGAVLMVLIFAGELALGWIEISSASNAAAGGDFWGELAAAGIAFLCVGFYEELFSRGYLLRNLAEGFNWKRFKNPVVAILIGWIGSSAVFGMMHAGNPNATLVSTINLIAAGLFLGLGYVLTGELAIPIGLHITWNFFQGNVFGFPVSGTNAGVTFISIIQKGPDWMTGGPFGPEAGVIGLLAIALGAAAIVAWVKRTRPQQSPIFFTPLAEYPKVAVVAAPAPEAAPAVIAAETTETPAPDDATPAA